MRPVFRWSLRIAVAVLALALLALLTLYVRGSQSLAATHDVPTAALTISTDSASVARGAHLAGIYGCRDCHGADLAGQVMSEEGPFRVSAPNLTPAGVGAAYDAEAWDRAIRHGVGADGTALFVMPSGAYNRMSDTEAADLVAFFETLGPVERDVPPMEFRALGRILAGGPIRLADGVYPDAAPETSPPPGATEAYGAYVAGMMCAYCHGADLAGEQPETPGSPYAPDLAASGQWPPEAFHRSLQTGQTPDGRQMDPEFMPWTSTARMTPDEREGLRLYLATLAARRAVSGAAGT